MVGGEPADAAHPTNLIAVTMHSPPEMPRAPRGDARISTPGAAAGIDWLQLARGLTESLSAVVPSSPFAAPVAQTGRRGGALDDLDAADRDADAALLPLDSLREFETATREGWGWLASSVDRIEARELREREARDALDAAGLYGGLDPLDDDSWAFWEDHVTRNLYGARAFELDGRQGRPDDWARLLSPAYGEPPLGGAPYSDVENDFALPAFGATDEHR
jgi:hypothetical protein